jgi:hypothetical protein
MNEQAEQSELRKGEQAEQPKAEHAEQREQAELRQPGERVYAPASARVAKPPAPGHEALVARVDDSTPERQGAVESEDVTRTENERSD